MSNISKTNFSLLLVVVMMMASCNKEEVPNVFEINLYDAIEINISGLANLGDGYVYEVWAIVDNSPESIGTFTINDSEKNFKKEFKVKSNKLAKTSSIMVSIEPVDSDPNPSDVIVLSSESVTGKVPSPLSIKENIGDFSDVEGFFTLLSPSDGNDTRNEKSGLWFVKDSKAGLKLPELGSGWIYEAWIGCENGKKLSLGKFSSSSSSDHLNKYCDKDSFSYPFPGEDLLKNAPAGFTFPIDLVEESIHVWVTVEPYPDNSPEPFNISPLKAKLNKGKSKSHNAIKMDFNDVTKVYGAVKKIISKS